MKRFLKRFRYGEKGFTLIELLVVIGILGILAAVVIPNVGRFMGAGTVEAANTEAHNVQTAVLGYMVDNSLSGYDGAVGPGHTASPTGPEGYFTGSLQATYTITNGEITAADGTGGKWAGLEWSAGLGWHKAGGY